MTSETSPVFSTTYTQAPRTIMATREFKLSIARTPCEVQNAAAVQTVRQAPLKRTCTGLGRCCVFQRDWTSAPPRPISTVSPKLNKAMAIRMKTKFVEMVVLKPGRRIFIAEASMAKAKNRTKCPKFSGFHREATTVSTATASAAIIAMYSLALVAIHRPLPTANLRRHAQFSPPIMTLMAVDVVWFVVSLILFVVPQTTEVDWSDESPQTTPVPQSTDVPFTNTFVPQTTEVSQTASVPQTTLVPVTRETLCVVGSKTAVGDTAEASARSLLDSAAAISR